jgi:hypothetical protein
MDNEGKETTVYRVCAGSASTWNVFAEPGERPVASFPDKSAAVSYAMRLARGKVSWRSLFDAARTRTAHAP